MIQRGDTWAIASRPRVDRICVSHIDEIEHFFRGVAQAIRETFGRNKGLEKGYVTTDIPANGRCKDLLEAAEDAKKRAAGTEAMQRRDKSITVAQLHAMYESLLRCEEPRKGQEKDQVIKTLCLGLGVSFQYGLGKRGVNVDSLTLGYLAVDRWPEDSHFWTGQQPFYLATKSSGKGDGASFVPADVMHARNPVACPLMWLGLHLGYLLFQENFQLATEEKWVSTDGHERHLIVGRQGEQLTLTQCGRDLKSTWQHIGAGDVDMHMLRNLRQEIAAMNPEHSPESVDRGAGYHFKSERDKSYRGYKDSSWMLSGAFYNGVRPQSCAAHVKVVELYQDGTYPEGRRLLDKLIEDHTTQSRLRELAKSTHAPIVTFLEVLRLCLLTAIVCSASRPRDRHGYIQADSPPMREIIHECLVPWMRSFWDTDDYATIQKRVREYEDAELDSPHAHYGPEARHTGAIVESAKAELIDVVRTEASGVVAALQPRMDEAKDEAENNKKEQAEKDEDQAFYNALPPEMQETFHDISTGIRKTDYNAVRKLRLSRERNEAAHAATQPLRKYFRNSGCIRCAEEARPQSHCPHRPAAAPSSEARLSPPVAESPLMAEENRKLRAQNATLQEKNAALQAEVEARDAEIHALREKVRVLRADAPPNAAAKLPNLAGNINVEQLLMNWVLHFVPGERVDKKPYRGSDIETRKATGNLINEGYLPPLYAVAERWKSSGNLWTAVDEVQGLLNKHTESNERKRNWKNFGRFVANGYSKVQKSSFEEALIDPKLEEEVKAGREATSKRQRTE